MLWYNSTPALTSLDNSGRDGSQEKMGVTVIKIAILFGKKV